MSSKTATGVLERWLAPKGFGFIRPDDRGKPNGGLFVDRRDIPALERGEDPREGGATAGTSASMRSMST
jgi:hypothetical protein